MKRSLTLYLTIAVYFIGCSPTTQITGTWTNPDVSSQNYDRIFVAAMTDNMQAKRQVEENLATDLREKGVAVETSSKLFPPNFTDDHAKDKETILEKVREEGYDAETEKLIWSAQSESYDPSSLNTFAEGFAEVVIEQLNEDDFI